MNGYDLSRQWFSFAYENTEAKPIHTALYFWIVERANASGWKKIIDIQTEKSMDCLGVTDWRTYKNALQFLADHNFIAWVEKSKNQYTCNRISIVLKEGEVCESFRNAYAQNAEPHAEAIAEAIAEAYAEPYVKAIAEALQSYINLKTNKPKNPKTSKPLGSAPPEETADKDWNDTRDKKGSAPPGSAPPPKPKAKKESKPDLLFKESEVFDREDFKAAFSGTDYEYADLNYYHEVIKNWSDSGAHKKKDWVATAKNWMLRDSKENKLKLKNGTQQQHYAAGAQSTAQFGKEVDDYVARRYGT